MRPTLESDQKVGGAPPEVLWNQWLLMSANGKPTKTSNVFHSLEGRSQADYQQNQWVKISPPYLLTHSISTGFVESTVNQVGNPL
jgi:hypothetical protein